jgi:5'-3' exonuclease
MIVKRGDIDQGPAALIDADGIIYRQMSGRDALNQDFYDLTQKVDDKFNTILDRLNTNNFRLYTTSRESYRKKLYPEYKAKRKKQAIPFLGDMYQYVKETWNSYSCPKLEADDCVSIDARDLRKKGIPYVVVSIDGDLDQIPGSHFHPYYRANHVQQYYISPAQAQYVFCTQMILSRPKDGLTGIKGMGEVAAKELLTLGDKDNVKKVHEQYLLKYGKELGEAEFKKHYTLVRLMQTPPDNYELYDQTTS